MSSRKEWACQKWLERLIIKEATGKHKLGCLNSLGSQRKVVLGMGPGDKPQTSCQLSIAIEFKKHVPVRKGVGLGKKR